VPKSPLPERTSDDAPNPKTPEREGDRHKHDPRADAAGTEDEAIFVLEAPIADSAPTTPAQEKPSMVLPSTGEGEGVDEGDPEKARVGDGMDDGVTDNRRDLVGLDAATDQSG